MMSQVQSTTVVNAGCCFNVQDKIFGAKQMETASRLSWLNATASSDATVLTVNFVSKHESFSRGAHNHVDAVQDVDKKFGVRHVFNPCGLICRRRFASPWCLQPREEGTALLRFQRRFLMTTPSLCKLAHLSASWEDAVEISFRGSSGLTFECLPDPLNASAGLSLSPTQW